MPLAKTRDAEPIRGYRLLEPLGSGGFGEVWKCAAPGGAFKAMKFVYGEVGGLASDDQRAENELRAVRHIKSIRHPSLLSIDHVASVEGELVIVTELADQNLEELRQEFRRGDQAGIPRQELLTYLRDVAEVLDLLNLRFGLQHLDIKPQNLFLIAGRAKVADFGLVSSLVAAEGKWAGERIHLGALTPQYCATEVFQGKLSRHCDQYSLAIVFQELLTGRLPFVGQNSRQLLLQHTKAEPDLTPLDASDRSVVARALAKKPEDRFPSCADFINALMMDAIPNAVVPPPATIAGDNGASIHGDIPSYRTRPKPPEGVLPDHRFLERMGQCSLFELWLVETPSGQRKQAKIVRGFDTWTERRLSDACTRLSSLNHPALLPADVLQAGQDCIVAVSDRPGRSIRDRFQECLDRGTTGIPRDELIGHLRAAAEVLDYLYEQHGVQHLGLNTTNLLLENCWLQVADFGLAQVLWLGSGRDIAQRNSRYAPPELFSGRVHRSSDQYSLALMYAELLSGAHPFVAASTAAAWSEEPDLSKLTDRDRDVIARALDKDHARRWRTCSEMLLALEGIQHEDTQEGRPADRFCAMLQGPRKPTTPRGYGKPLTDVRDKLAELVKSVSGKSRQPDKAEVPQIAPAGDVITYTFKAGLPIGSARDKLESFQLPWPSERIRHDDDGLVIRVDVPANLWRRCLGKSSSLVVHVQQQRVQPRVATPIEITTRIIAFDCGRQRGKIFLDSMSPLILESVRNLFLLNSERRSEDRVPWPHPIKVIPLLASGRHDVALAGQGKDISLNGMGFYLPSELRTAEVLIELPNLIHPPAIHIAATLVHARRGADGWYDVGAVFRHIAQWGASNGSR